MDTATRSSRRPRLRRVVAVVAGVVMVPALYAVATAETGGGAAPSTVSAGSQRADDPGTETEIEHGVVVEKPHGGAPTPGVPEATTRTTPQTSTPTPTAPEPTTPPTPQATTPTVAEHELEHPVPEPGDDGGVDPSGDDHRGRSGEDHGRHSGEDRGGHSGED